MLRYCYIFIVLCLLESSSNAQGNLSSVTGKVVQKDGEVIPGVTLMLEGTPIGVVAEIDGTYEITGIEPGIYTVSISGVGYKKSSRVVDLKPGQQTLLNVTLEILTHELKENVDANIL